LKNAVDALNFGATSYIMKPVDPAELLKTIKKRLESKKQTEEITRDKLAKWIQSQALKTQSSNFQEFLEKTAKELARFGLTKNQARIYTTLIASGVASTSEIANLSKVRREEVYRIIPELEKRGIIVRKLEKPRKFAAVQPETSIKILAQSKLKNMKEEIDELQQEQAKLIAELKTMALSTRQEDCAIEAISQQDIVFEKLLEMTRKAKQKIAIITTTTNLRLIYMSYPRKVVKGILKSVRMRVITEKCELDTFSREILQPSETIDNSVELRCLKKLPFSLFIVDDKEALWGTQPTRTDEKVQVYWANDPTQLSILQASFERLWQESSKVKT
jgi:sugar-specific transcriptional regulator TrmB